MGYFLIVTSVTPFIKLLARTHLWSRVTDVLRTILPPPGIGQVWNFAIVGSKRTNVVGSTLAILLVPNSAMKIAPLELTASHSDGPQPSAASAV